MTWTATANAVGTANLFTKNAGGGAWNAGGFSRESIARDGIFEFSCAETNTFKLAGLSSVDGGITDATIQFGVYPATGGLIYIQEMGVQRNGGNPVATFVANDLFRVQAKTSVITYWKNGGLIWTSAVVPTFPLFADCAMFDVGSTITRARIRG